jgi:hypothetical protein
MSFDDFATRAADGVADVPHAERHGARGAAGWVARRNRRPAAEPPSTDTPRSSA